jgi:hypothetical protein
MNGATMNFFVSFCFNFALPCFGLFNLEFQIIDPEDLGLGAHWITPTHLF